MKSTPDESLQLYESTNFSTNNYIFNRQASNLTTNCSQHLKNDGMARSFWNSSTRTEKLNELDLNMDLDSSSNCVEGSLPMEKKENSDKDGSSICIRKLEESEVSELKKLHMKLVNRPFSKIYFSKLASGEINSIGVFHTQKKCLVGCLTWSLAGEANSIIHFVGLKEKYRNQGLGSSLVLFACQLMKIRNIETVSVTLESDDAPLIKFLEKRGFRTLMKCARQSALPGQGAGGEEAERKQGRILLSKDLKIESDNSQLADYSFLGLNESDLKENCGETRSLDAILSFFSSIFGSNACCGGAGRPKKNKDGS